MSSALHKSGIAKKSLLASSSEQNELFIDKSNINLTKSVIDSNAAGGGENNAEDAEIA
jgi:hypothetical protein